MRDGKVEQHKHAECGVKQSQTACGNSGQGTGTVQPAAAKIRPGVSRVGDVTRT